MNQIEASIREAGRMILEAHIQNSNIHQKSGPANFVTDYDVKIQKFLIDRLTEILPGCSFYGEEDTEHNEHILGNNPTFFIDPIDGTTNFMFDYHNSCVSVGLAEQKEITAGWVYNPYTDQMFTARRGEGAWLIENNRKNENNVPARRRLTIENKGLEEGICAFGCARYNAGDGIFDILPELFNHSLAIRSGGSAAIDLCRIASGSNVAYIEMLLQPYDYAAASVIIEEAGGIISQTADETITLDKGCPILAGTPKATEEIRKLLKV